MRQSSVLLVQRILPPYRLPFFLRLNASHRFTWTFGYGRTVAGSALISVLNPPLLQITPLHNTYLGSRTHFVYQRGLLRLLRSKQYHVVIGEFNLRILSNLIACFYARRLRIPFIWWGHGVGPRRLKLSIWLRIWLIRYADAVIFYDSLQAQIFTSRGVPQEKVFVAPNSIDVEAIEGLVEDRQFDERPYILYIGRLITEKKVDLLIHAFAAACPNLRPEIKLVIIGEGPQLTFLKQLVAQLGLAERVEFTGAIYEQEQLAPWFNASWVSVSPGYVGLSAIHSLAYGLPMITAHGEPHRPEITSLKDGQNAVYVAPGNSEAFARALIELAAQPMRWEHMSKDARHTIQEKWSLSAMVQAFEEAVEYAFAQKH